MNLQSGWYAILSSREVTPEPREVRRFGLDLVAWRTRVGTAVIQANRCAHRSAKLSLGTIKKDCIKCPYHLSDGHIAPSSVGHPRVGQTFPG